MAESGTPHYAEPKKLRLLWNHREKRHVTEQLPAQTVEIVSTFYSNPSVFSLDMRHEAKPENLLTWTNDNLVTLTSFSITIAANLPASLCRMVEAR